MPGPKFQPAPVDPYKTLVEKKLVVKSLVEDDLREILKRMKRRMAKKTTFRNNRRVTADVRMNYRVFLEIFRVFKQISKHSVTVKIESTKYSDTKKDPRFKSMLARVRSWGQWVDSMEKMGIPDIRSYLEKEFDDGQFQGRVKISLAKPLELSYSTTSSIASLTAHYEVINEFGIAV